MNIIPSVEELKTIMEYNSDTGVVLWKVRRHGRGGAIDPGDPVGSRNIAGYLETKVNGYRTYVHRIAWALHHGNWPSGNIDHKDGDRMNNAISNLRDCSQRINCENRRKTRKDNTSGYTGVMWRADSQKWTAVIQVKGKRIRNGSFDTPEQAGQAYLHAKRQLHEGNTL